MSGFDWKKTLATVAPAIATALGGPLGGVAVAMATKALGLDENTQDALQNAIAGGTPETLAKLKEVEANFQKEMKALDIDLERINATDRASARDMAAKTSIKPQVVLAAIYITGFVGILLALFSGEIELSDSLRDPAMLVLGALIAGNEQIRNFFFGSSTGSKEKTAALANQGK